MPSGLPNSNRVAIVGASSLRGKELKLVLEERNFPADEIILLDESVMAGTLTEAGGEPTFIRELAADSFEKVRFAFFAGIPADTERNWQAAQAAGATVIDLTGVLAASGKATSWIPSLTPLIPPKPGPGANGSAHKLAYASPASPVVISCTLAAGLAKLSPRTIAATLFPPVSERDQAGIDELETQTTNLLSFRPIEQTIFDTQVAFNLLSKYGDESKPQPRIHPSCNRPRRRSVSRRARARAGDSIDADAGVLRLCFLRLRGICRRHPRSSNWPPRSRIWESRSQRRKIPRRRTSASQVKAKFSWRRFRQTRTSPRACGSGELRII